jgi:DNA-directed RNA polymerase subunit RPC12/RpoP
MCVINFTCSTCGTEVPWEENERGYPTRTCEGCLKRMFSPAPVVVYITLESAEPVSGYALFE